MKIDVTTNIAKEWFENWNRDYYSWEGLEAIIEYYNEIDENMEFDVVAICCDCTEYGGHGAACNFENLISEYDYLLDRKKWEAENIADPEEWEDTTEAYIDALVEELEEQTTVLHISNGNYIIFSF